MIPHIENSQHMSQDNIFQEVAGLLAVGFLRLKKNTPNLEEPSSKPPEQVDIPHDSTAKESSEFAKNRLDTRAN